MKTLMRQGAFAVLVLAATTLISPINTQAQESSESSRKVLVQTPATYPTLARSMNIRGSVKLQAQVAPNGTVKKIDVMGGHPLLTQSAVTAVGHWKFEPGPKETKESIEIKFDPQ
jgi:TonB family protein